MRYFNLFIALIAIILTSCGTTNTLVPAAEPTTIRDTIIVVEQLPCDTVYVLCEDTTSYVEPPTIPSGFSRDRLGVVITPASDRLITGIPDAFTAAFRHVRYMGNGYSLRNWQDPSSGALPYDCISDTKNVWQDCMAPGMRDNMDRLYKLRSQFPDATITFVNEYFIGDGWPRKTLTFNELIGTRPKLFLPEDFDGSSLINRYFNKSIATINSKSTSGALFTLTSEQKFQIYDIYRQEYDVVLRSLGSVGGDVVLEVMNENWAPEYKQIADIQYMAAMDAHKIHALNGGTVRLSTGPRQWSRRTITWASKDPLTESILDVPIDFLRYLDETNGVVSINFYPSELPDQWGNPSGNFVSRSNWDKSPDWEELTKLSRFLAAYPNIDFNVSETGYTSSPNEKYPTKEELVGDRWFIEDMLSRFDKSKVNIAYLYQINEHGINEVFDTNGGLIDFSNFFGMVAIVKEGKFNGTSVAFDLDWWTSRNKVGGK